MLLHLKIDYIRASLAVRGWIELPLAACDHMSRTVTALSQVSKASRGELGPGIRCG
jgi:hypothetical protein